MSINGINSATIGSTFTPVSSAYIAATPATTKTATNESTADAQDTQDTVSISSAGRAALSADVGAPLRDNAAAKKDGIENDASEEPMTLIDQQIQKIKEQIKALQKMLAKLKGDDSEVAEQQRKLIQEQIMQLSSQIATLTDKKMRDAQKSA
ncbi:MULTISPECIES: FlxA-like family protein [unclassified Shewanella]|uniref:FlxA-like family protein n=1 Tax=Shewanella TaxID=22 RepID=UPI0021D8FDCB|nr:MULTISPECIES: FlxA-like family protein [unclassified Shewanella]MCU8009376.1 FlxA-like family protein [Shewanella sp. SM87]MCU8011969.1 FlxA-like family protein [Shewanella sp. SM74]MCU8075622.1 FlxA-like family protein [Shewanella sp. SM29]MCU8087983.1 FlxA-like family protein [Shewanella sp. SM21]